MSFQSGLHIIHSSATSSFDSRCRLTKFKIAGANFWEIQSTGDEKKVWTDQDLKNNKTDATWQARLEELKGKGAEMEHHRSLVWHQNVCCT